MFQENNRKVFKEFPFELINVDEKTKKHLVTMRIADESLLVGPKKYLIQNAYKTLGIDFYNFEARPDDVWLLGFFRSGTTLHSEIIWLIGNDLNFEEASKELVYSRVPQVDSGLYLNQEEIEAIAKAEKSDATQNTLKTLPHHPHLSLDRMNKQEGRRFMQSHLPISLLPPSIFQVGAKVIYCARNPKDVGVSYYYLFGFVNPKTTQDLTFKSFVHKFMNNLVMLAPYWEHIKEAWANRHNENFLFLFYEDFSKDKRDTIAKISKFLDKNFTEAQIAALEDHLEIDNFKKNKSVNMANIKDVNVENKQFIRRGKAGGWREYFDEELSKEFDEWVEKNLQGTDLKFPDC